MIEQTKTNFDFNSLEERDDKSKISYNEVYFRKYGLYVTKNKYYEIIVLDKERDNKEVYKELCGSNKVDDSIISTFEYYKLQGIIVNIDDKIKYELNENTLSKVKTFPKPKRVSKENVN